MKTAVTTWCFAVLAALLLAPVALAAPAARLPADIILLEAGQKGSGYRLVEIRTDGTHRALSGYIKCDAAYLDLSPGGEAALVASSPPYGLRVVSLADGRVTAVPAPEGSYVLDAPRWSPSGRQIAFTLDALHPASVVERAPAQLMLWDEDTQQTRPLITAAFDVTSPAWSPDGKEIAIIGAEGLELVHVSDGHRTVLVKSAGRGYALFSPSWSPDGRQLAFLRVSFAPPLGPRSVLFTVDTSTQKTREVSSIPGYASALAWSPDGRYLLFSGSGGSGARNEKAPRVETMVIEVPSGRQVRLPGARRFVGMSWSPRGDAILARRADEWSQTRMKLSWVAVTFPEGKQITVQTISGVHVNYIGQAAWLPQPAGSTGSDAAGR